MPLRAATVRRTFSRRKFFFSLVGGGCYNRSDSPRVARRSKTRRVESYCRDTQHPRYRRLEAHPSNSSRGIHFTWHASDERSAPATSSNIRIIRCNLCSLINAILCNFSSTARVVEKTLNDQIYVFMYVHTLEIRKRCGSDIGCGVCTWYTFTHASERLHRYTGQSAPRPDV